MLELISSKHAATCTKDCLQSAIGSMDAGPQVQSINVSWKVFISVDHNARWLFYTSRRNDLSRVCNPKTVFSSPGSGIEKFPVPGSRDWK